MKLEDLKIKDYELSNVYKDCRLARFELKNKKTKDYRIIFVDKNCELVADFDTRDINFGDIFCWCIYPLSNKNNRIFVIEKGNIDKDDIFTIVEVDKNFKNTHTTINEYNEIRPCNTDDLFTVRKGELWGYIDCEGNEFIKPQYKACCNFNNGIACVFDCDAWGFIDKNNKAITPFIYDTAHDDKTFFNLYDSKTWEDERLALVSYEGKYGVINDKNETVIPFKYDDAYSRCDKVSANLFCVKSGGKWGFIDKEDNVVIDFEFDEVKPVEELPCFMVKKNGFWGLVNCIHGLKHDLFIECKYQMLIVEKNVILAGKKNGKYVLLNHFGKEISKEYYNIDFNYDKDIFKVQLEHGGKYGFINNLGKVLIPCKYERVLDFKDDIAIVRNENDNEVINKKGEVLYKTKNWIINMYNGNIIEETADNEYVSIKILDDSSKKFKDVSVVFPYSKWNNIIQIDCNHDDWITRQYKHETFFLNKENKIIAHFESDGCLNAEFLSNKNNSIYAITKRGFYEDNNIEQIVKVNPDLSYEVLHNVEYIEHGIEDDTFAIRKNGLYGFIDYNGSEFIKPQYEEYHAFHLGIAAVKKNGKWGFINKQNETVIPFMYDMDYDFYYFPKMHNDKLLIPVALNGKFGIIDIENNVVIPFEYENIYCCGNYFIAQKDGKTGIIDINENIILPFEYSEGEGDIGEYPYHLIAKDGLTGLLDNDMNFIAPCKYKELIVNENSIVAKKQNDKHVLLNFKGEEISKEFDKIDDYSSEGLYHAEIGKKYGYIDDKTGKIVIPFKYNRILNDFIGGIAESELPDFSVDIIDKKGNVLYHTKGYKEVYNLGNGCILAQNENHEFEIVRLVLFIGFWFMDCAGDGLKGGDLRMIVSCPQGDNNVFTLNLAKNVAIKQKIPVLIFSLEMSSVQLTELILCSETEISRQNARAGKLNSEDWSKIAKVTNKLKDSQIIIQDFNCSKNVPISEIIEYAQKIKKEQDKLGLILINYLEIIKNENIDEHKPILAKLKLLAQELNVPILVFAPFSEKFHINNAKKLIGAIDALIIADMEEELKFENICQQNC